LTPSTPVSKTSRDLALECGDQGRLASAANLITQCKRFLIDPEDASKRIDEMDEIVKARWLPIARAEGVTEADCARVKGAFAYEGFRQ
jgi:serine/threonine-protein kinase HipA